jgi:hypothetical protein
VVGGSTDFTKTVYDRSPSIIAEEIALYFASPNDDIDLAPARLLASATKRHSHAHTLRSTASPLSVYDCSGIGISEASAKHECAAVASALVPTGAVQSSLEIA